MELFTLIIFTTSPQANLQCVFRSKPAAEAAYAKLSAARAEVIRGGDRTYTTDVTDDYGRSYFIDSSAIAVVSLNQVSLELNGQIELQLLQAHGNADLQKRVAQDLKLQQQGPAIVPARGAMAPFPQRQN